MLNHRQKRLIQNLDFVPDHRYASPKQDTNALRGELRVGDLTTNWIAQMLNPDFGVGIHWGNGRPNCKQSRGLITVWVIIVVVSLSFHQSFHNITSVKKCVMRHVETDVPKSTYIHHMHKIPGINIVVEIPIVGLRTSLWTTSSAMIAFNKGNPRHAIRQIYSNLLSKNDDPSISESRGPWSSGSSFVIMKTLMALYSIFQKSVI